MKKKFILLPLVGAFLFLTLSSYHTGPAHVVGEDATGASAPNGCFCHGGGVASPSIVTVALELDDAGVPVTTYIPGHAYTVKITGTQIFNGDSLPNFGFQVAVVNLAGAGTSSATNAGTLTAPAGNYQLSTGTSGGASINIVEHSDYLTPATGVGRAGTTYIVSSIPWTAPVSGTGSVKIFGTINAVNHSGAPDTGDHWNQNNLIICERVAAIAGTLSVCPGATTTLTDATAGGTWTSGNTGVATVTGGGVVTGVVSGPVVISYNGGCSGTATTTVNVLAPPSAIAGNLNVCQGSSTTLNDPSGLGTWVSSATSIATANLITGAVGGVVTGSSTPATANITFTYATTGCTTTSTVTVNPLPSTIAGTATVCQGATTLLTDGTPGGTWSSSNTAAATVSTGSGLVSAVATGSPSAATSVITYTSNLGCTRSITVTINPIPNGITGTANMCPGATTTLSDATLSGTWSSNNSTIASVNASGLVTGGASAGTTTISYIVAGCAATTPVTVNTPPTTITGSTSICSSTTTTLNSTPAGGTWTSSNTTTASIGGANGVVTAGPGTGTTLITYTGTNTCITSTTLTVNALPTSISGTMTVCSGGNTLLTSSPTGGTWSSNNPSIASVLSGSGSVTGGAAAGVTTITYTAPGGCAVTTQVTVNGSVFGITGTPTVCVGSTTLLADASVGGSWSSTNLGIATVTTGGLVTGVTAGTSTIIFTVGTCFASVTVTVNPAPGIITGSISLCAGTTGSLSNSLTGGTWTSSNTAIATIGSLSGSITGGASPGGTTTINYVLPTGCATNIIATVTPLPAAITGTMGLCSGSTTTLSSSPAGGTWNSGNTSIATVDASSGLVTGGIAVGAAPITYSLSAGCNAITAVTVSSQPAAISGAAVLCTGMITTLTDGTPGGTWSSNNTAVASVPTGAGTVTGGTPGTATITYSTGVCNVSKDVTVNALPTGIGGTTTVCRGLTTTLSNGTAGGSWSSSSALLATVDPSSGVVTGVGAGTPVITYSLGAGCNVTTPVTVNPIFAISGASSICSGLTASLTDGAPGGTWSTSDNTVATINTTTGSMTGNDPGTATITYLLSTGCTASTTVTVVSSPPAITGDPNVCIGSTTPLSNPGGGTWTSSNTAVATVGLFSGIVSGVTAGPANITYSLGSGCAVNLPVTVNPLPSAITGTTHVCIGSTTTLSDLPAGGTWNSNNGNASADLNTGVITGISAGSSIVSYTSPVGCVRTTALTINALPAAITGNMSMCIAASTTLADPAGAGTWTSDNGLVATVTPTTGIITGAGLGSTNISYTAATTGCTTFTNVTVNSLPGAITGNPTVCAGGTTTLADPATGGTWTSSAPATATIGFTSGDVTGGAPGVAIISYSFGAGCAVTKLVTVNALPSAIIGNPNLCVGSTEALIDAPAGGFWSSSNNSIATITLSTGIVSAVAEGLDTMTYIIGSTGCSRSMSINVHPLPESISGALHICSGSATNLSDSTAGGTWVSGATSVATIGLTNGAVTTVSSGTANITYTLSTGCKTVSTLTVNPLPSAISGTGIVCTGATTTLSDITTGGTWAGSGSGVTSVGAGTGVVSGISAGTDLITYTIATGCTRTMTVIVNQSPASITGTGSICSGNTLTLSDVTAGGTWSSGSTSVASVGSLSGFVTGGTTAGTATITYKTSNGCTTNTGVIVNPIPTAISGSANVCTGSATLLSSIPTGGTWTSSATAVATVNTVTGVVTGLIPGFTTITYTSLSNCQRSIVVSVNPTPLAITGATEGCMGTTATLIDPTIGGTWSSSSPSTATVGLFSGIITGVSAGTVTIDYTLPTGCSTQASYLSKQAPTAVTGPGNVCNGATTSLSASPAGGTWTSSNTAVVTIDAVSGSATGVAASSATVSYALSTGCSSSAVLNVNPLPAPITGVQSVCGGNTTVLADIITGGTWSSGSTTVATVVASTGLVTGVLPGTASITYALPTGCLTTVTVSVNPAPGAISGPANVCAGSSIIQTDAAAGGTWSSGSPAIGTINTGTGSLTGVTAGTTIVTYTLSSGCSTARPIAVNPLPLPITGNTTVCTGGTSILGDANAGGTWTSGNAAVAYIDPTTGSMSGASAGLTTISYTLITGCNATTHVTINQSPSAISGSTVVCTGGTTQLSDVTTGGTWSSSNPAVASVNQATGVVTGTGLGSATITYKHANGCTATTVVEDNCSVGIQQIISATGEIVLMPNPNKGDFLVTGVLGPVTNKEVFIEVVDMTGRVVYKDVQAIKDGTLNNRIILNSNLSDGMYLLNLHAGGEYKTLQFVIQK